MMKGATMNQATKDIMKLLKVSRSEAKDIQDVMSNLFGIDFSACSKSEFNRTAREARRELKEAIAEDSK
jgi:hypothetical protein